MEETIYENYAESINILRINNKGKVLATKDISKMLNFLPFNVANFMVLLTKFHILNKISYGKYSFSENPIYKDVIKNMLIDYKSVIKNYGKTKKKKIKEATPKETDLKDLLSTWNISLDDVAKYLVSTGNYKITKRIEEWKTI